jgi:hypothetical protein
MSGASATYHYAENWAIWSETFGLDFDSGSNSWKLTDCEPGTVIMTGSDHGTWNLRTSLFRSNGRVTYASGPFAGMGRHVVQDGLIEYATYLDLDDVPGFFGTFRLN